MEQEIYLEPASKGTRLANLLIDIAGFYALLILIGVFIGLLQVTGTANLLDEDNSNIVLQYLLSYSLYVLFYTLIEGLTKGRSFGKFITGTVAVKSNGTNFSWKDALLRSLVRIVPFEAFSAFGYAPWHDRWTDTLVVKKQKH